MKQGLRLLEEGWRNPKRTFRPHTRWWWPGNALTRSDITWQLEEMAAQGIGGVEIMSAWDMYEKGNIAYLSAEFLDLIKHSVAEGSRLDMEVAITFSPGWSFGGPWVAKADQSKALTMAMCDWPGGTRATKLPVPEPRATDGSGVEHIALVAVVAGRLEGECIDGSSLVVLTDKVRSDGQTLDWDVPQGDWRVMAFRLIYTGQICHAQSCKPPAMVIDHLNAGAVHRYCETLGGAFRKVVGAEFGRTVDSFFCDSFEVHSPEGATMWTTDVLERFQKCKGYDLTPYLPVIWFDIGPLTPRIRYDYGRFMSELGLEAFYKPFNAWCDANRVQARIQPHYRFVTELIAGAGASARPETEVTTARFDPTADPRKATASGARFNGRNILSAEAYTFIHPTRYLTDLQDLKIATDAFLRDGVTQFYNHGYFASPEAHIAPTRDIPFASRISHWSTWWRYYGHLARYVSRSCFMLRQGKFVGDVLIYSPQATMWSERALWGRARRVMPYGNLARTLVANGYDFDIVNDDLLTHKTKARNGRVEIAELEYRVLLIPNVSVLPVETMEAIHKLAEAGVLVIALGNIPTSAAGLQNHEQQDAELDRLVREVFSRTNGIHIPDYVVSRHSLGPNRQPITKTSPLDRAQRRLLEAIGKVVAPDFRLAGGEQSDGLTFIHRCVGDIDIYFVTNLEPEAVSTEVTFRVKGKVPIRWDAVTGSTGGAVAFREEGEGTTVPLAFEAWESAFFVFVPEAAQVAGEPQSIPKIRSQPLHPKHGWRIVLEGHEFPRLEITTKELASWTESPPTRHFSGTGIYECVFDVPAEARSGMKVELDLGRVGTVAEVEVNGKPAGTAWMHPYRVEISDLLIRGENQLRVLVTNTIANHVMGLKGPVEVPVELQSRLGKANPQIYTLGQQEIDADRERGIELPLSGLMGPVALRVSH